MIAKSALSHTCLVTILGLLLIPVSAQASQKRVRPIHQVHVTAHQVTGTTTRGAQVSLTRANTGNTYATANRKGKFIFKTAQSLKPVTFRLTATKSGYRDRSWTHHPLISKFVRSTTTTTTTSSTTITYAPVIIIQQIIPAPTPEEQPAPTDNRALLQAKMTLNLTRNRYETAQADQKAAGKAYNEVAAKIAPLVQQQINHQPLTTEQQAQYAALRTEAQNKLAAYHEFDSKIDDASKAYDAARKALHALEN